MSRAPGLPPAGHTHVFTIRRPSDDTKAYTTRKPHKKSKSGCAACKSKRVKCDEKKPVCVRCQRSGAVCRYGDYPAPTDKALEVGVQRPPNAMSEVSFEVRLACHYDRVTGDLVDTITFSNFLAGVGSPQYRRMVLDEADRVSADYLTCIHSVYRC